MQKSCYCPRNCALRTFQHNYEADHHRTTRRAPRELQHREESQRWHRQHRTSPPTPNASSRSPFRIPSPWPSSNPTPRREEELHVLQFQQTMLPAVRVDRVLLVRYDGGAHTLFVQDIDKLTRLGTYDLSLPCLQGAPQAQEPAMLA